MDYRLGIYEKAMPNSFSLLEKLQCAKETGFDYMEISIDETEEKQKRLFYSKDDKLAIKMMLHDLDFSIDSMCLSAHRKWALGSKDPEVQRKGLSLFYRSVDFCHDIGIRIIQLAGYDVYYEESDEITRQNFITNLQKGIYYASKKGIVCAFETMETPFMDTISKAVDYVKLIDSPYLGIYPDLGNLNNACLIYNLDIEKEIKAGKGHIFALHLKETKEGKYRDMNFGEGLVDFKKGIKAAKEIGIRMFVAECWDNGEDPIERLTGVKDYLKKEFEG